jgi:ParB/RepB/Spo0J family partition protein
VKPIQHDEYDYQLVVGYRRMTAHQILGEEVIDAFVRKGVDEHQASVLNVIENLQRDNPGFWEQCCALRDTFDPELGDTAISKELGKSRSWVRSRWLVWKLPPDVIAQVEAGLLTAVDVSLLIHKSPEEQQAAADRLLAGKEAGETTQQMQTELSKRRSLRPKKEVQAMMTKLMADDKMDLVHALRWALGEITDAQLMGLINQ